MQIVCFSNILQIFHKKVDQHEVWVASAVKIYNIVPDLKKELPVLYGKRNC